MSDRATTFAILQALKWQSRNHIWATELQFKDWNSTGEFFGAPYYIDFYRIQPGRHMHAESFEIKASRADLLKELKTPKKHADAVKWSDQFWFVTPKGLANPNELPEYAGLLEWTGQKFIKKKKAPVDPKAAAEWRIIVNILKHSNIVRDAQDAYNEMKNLQFRIDALEYGRPNDSKLWDLQNEVKQLRDVEQYACGEIRAQNFRLKASNKSLFEENRKLVEGTGIIKLEAENHKLKMRIKELENGIKT